VGEGSEDSIGVNVIVDVTVGFALGNSVAVEVGNANGVAGAHP
jgi:hypothetical protein